MIAKNGKIEKQMSLYLHAQQGNVLQKQGIGR
jgi:hypothetical protein